MAGPLGLRPEPLTSLGHTASVPIASPADRRFNRGPMVPPGKGHALREPVKLFSLCPSGIHSLTQNSSPACLDRAPP